MAKTGYKSKVDLDALAVDVRGGMLTYGQMQAKHGITPGRISQLKAQHGWVADLSPSIRAKTLAKMAEAAVHEDQEVKKRIRPRIIVGPESPERIRKRIFSQEVLVEASANLQSALLLGHREELRRIKQTVTDLADELGTMSNRELRDALDTILDERVGAMTEKEAHVLRNAFEAALSLGGRSSSAKNLVSSLAMLIDKERQAYGADRMDRADGLSEFLKSIGDPRGG